MIACETDLGMPCTVAANRGPYRDRDAIFLEVWELDRLKVAAVLSDAACAGIVRQLAGCLPRAEVMMLADEWR